jgi:hypothetical protein
MIRSFVRTLRGHSRDPRMAYITRPLPKDLHDEDVVAALDIAMADTDDPGYLVETLRPALRQVTGHDYEVLDRTARDVTGAFVKPMVMIRDGDVGLWPGYAARAYPLLARNADLEETRAAIAGAEGADGATRKAGWEPPPPVRRAAPTAEPVGTETGASYPEGAGTLDDRLQGS